MKYQHKPTEVEALQWDGDHGKMRHLLGDDPFRWFYNPGGNRELYVNDTKGNKMRAEIGDYVVKSGEDEFFTVPQAAFERDYAPVPQ